MRKKYMTFLLLLIFIVLVICLFLVRATIYKLTEEDIENIRLQFEQVLLEDSDAYETLSKTPFNFFYDEYYARCGDKNPNIQVNVYVAHYDHYVGYGKIWFRYSKNCEELSEYESISEFLVEVTIKKINGKWEVIDLFEYEDASAEPY